MFFLLRPTLWDKDMTYSVQVTPRFTTWLVAALLALSAGYVVPSARVTNRCESAAIVWTAPHRASRSISIEHLAGVAAYQRKALPPFSNPEIQGFSSDLDSSLFQRPPPLSVHSRA